MGGVRCSIVHNTQTLKLANSKSGLADSQLRPCQKGDRIEPGLVIIATWTALPPNLGSECSDLGWLEDG